MLSFEDIKDRRRRKDAPSNAAYFIYQTPNCVMNIDGLNWWNLFAQTRAKPAGAVSSWNRYIRNGPKTQPFLTCFQRPFQEPYNGNRQQLHFVPHFIQKVEWDVPCDGHQLLEIGRCVLQLFSRSKHPSWRWLHRFLSPQSCWMQWVPHATACIQWTYVLCSSKGSL